MKNLTYLILITQVILLASCAASVRTIQTTIQTKPEHAVQPERIILVNTVEVQAAKYRDNKEELFGSLLKELIVQMGREIRNRSSVESIPLPELTKASPVKESRDTLIRSMMQDHVASDAIVITAFDVYFDQTNVDVTKNDDGSKNREAYYDIVSRINYVWYDGDGVLQDKRIETRRFHSSRSVLSGLLAAGPNVVKQSEDAFQIVLDNMHKYLNLFFPGKEARTRPLFVGKEFSQVNSAIDVGNYSYALEESQKYLTSPDGKIAARANYNCAVLLERLNRYDEVPLYLEESLRRYRLEEAVVMIRDY